ncbi:MAG TPA: DUF6526 family protein [Gemmatimonadales bacterium]|nr:DUF6526 family protein [Gemmatimonadales bacterium]
MSDDDVQNYGNHRRWNAPWHFVVLPLLLVNAGIALIVMIRTPHRGTIWAAVVALALVAGFMLLRRMVLTVQNRVVRLEEHLRLTRLMPDRHEEIEALTLEQLIAIRFASDAEVPHMLDRITRGEITTQDEIKRAVQHWRPDHLRA